MQHSAYTIRDTFGPGTGLLICGDAKDGDTLAVEMSNNSRREANVMSITKSSLNLLIGEETLRFKPWRENDDHLSKCPAKQSKWTQT